MNSKMSDREVGMNILVTGCCGVVSRAIARSIRLSRCYSGARLIGVDVCNYWYGLHETLFDRIYRVSDVDDSQAYAMQVRNICAKEEIDLAIIQPEKEVLFWTRNVLGVPVTLPPPGLAEVAGDKCKLYERLAATGLVPGFSVHNRVDLLSSNAQNAIAGEYPMWIRDISVGSDSGKGALRATDLDDIRAWVLLNRNIEEFMLSEYLPGRNFACCLLFDNDRLLKTCSYERLKYYMGSVAPSGVTGNISRGRLVNDERVLANAEAAVRALAGQTGEKVKGLFTVDLREDVEGTPLLTEINIRHTAPTSAYAAGGSNMVEAHIHHTLGRLDRIDGSRVDFPEDNYILRDMDGKPLWVHGVNLPEPGSEFVSEDTFSC